LRDSIQVITSENQLILLRCRLANSDTVQHLDTEADLLTQEVSDLDLLGVISNDDIDRKMGIDVTHLVLEALGNANDHVVDNGSDGSDACDMLAVAMVHDKFELVIFNKLDFHVEVTKVLCQFASWSLDGDYTGLDVNCNIFGNAEDIVFAQVSHFICVFNKGVVVKKLWKIKKIGLLFLVFATKF
jgi:hypothetical protein